MKTILKLLGVAAGTYFVYRTGWLMGVIDCDDCYNDRSVKNETRVEAAIDLNDLFISENIKKPKRKIKRSEVLRAHARKWTEAGFSSEEIKQGLDLLKKELD